MAYLVKADIAVVAYKSCNQNMNENIVMLITMKKRTYREKTEGKKDYLD